jgi:hypothetical protein
MFLRNILPLSSRMKHGSSGTASVMEESFRMVVMGPKESKDRSPV